ncbi:MAG: ATPase, partial [Sulfitobacter sp.]|nr:ATPase [Sulfitobacter sp.]
LWKRLAYVAITRAQDRLIWVVRNRLSKPAYALNVDDLRAAPAAALTLDTTEEEFG